MSDNRTVFSSAEKNYLSAGYQERPSHGDEKQKSHQPCDVSEAWILRCIFTEHLNDKEPPGRIF